MTPDEAFAITPEDRARLDAAPFLGTNDVGWRNFASGIHEQVMAAYGDGDITLERALATMRSCSLNCSLQDRIMLLALTAERALKNPPQEPRKRQPNPAWVRNSAASLVQMLREDRPTEQFAPNDLNNWTTPILEDAIRWLVALRLCEPVTARTIYGWWRDARKDDQPNSTSTA